jgi:hypothetical protein
MSRRSFFIGIVAAVCATAMIANPVRAHTYDKLTYLTFNGPIQIPGGTLEAGTYRFHLANPDTSRNVVQVLSHDGGIVYAMFHTIPDIRVTVTDEAVVTFREVPVGVAPPIRSLFYGGERRGYEFIYPREGWSLVSSIRPQPPITYEPIVAAEPVVVAEAAPVAEPEPLVTEPTFAPAELALEPAPTLPATASPLPLAALGGVVSLLLSLAVGLTRRALG